MIMKRQMISIVIKKRIDCAIIPEPVLTHYEKLKEKTTEMKNWTELFSYLIKRYLTGSKQIKIK